MKPKGNPAFKLAALLGSAGGPQTIVRYAPGQVVFSETDAADTIMYLQRGSVKMSAFSRAGKEAVVALLRARDFFGEECLAGQPMRMKRATAITLSVVLVIEKAQMVRLLRTQPALNTRFIQHLLKTKTRIEAGLVDQRVASCEQRLARTLLSLARYGKRRKRPKKVLPTVSQGTLAGMVGTTRSRINCLMNKFRRSGFITMNDGVTVNSTLLSVILPD